MARQCQAADFGRAGVEHVKHHPLTLLDADRLALTQHLAVDAEKVVADLIALGAGKLLVSLGPNLLQLVDWRTDEHVHLHVAATAEGRLELLQNEKDLA